MKCVEIWKLDIATVSFYIISVIEVFHPYPDITKTLCLLIFISVSLPLCAPLTCHVFCLKVKRFHCEPKLICKDIFPFLRACLTVTCLHKGLNRCSSFETIAVSSLNISIWEEFYLFIILRCHWSLCLTLVDNITTVI